MVKKSLFQYFIEYDDNDDIRPLCIRVPQMIGYVKYFENNNKTMSFKVIDKKMLKKLTKIWGKISSLMNKVFDSEPAYGDNDNQIKTKIKSNEDKINTNFQSKKITKGNTSYKCLPLIILDSVIRVNKKYYPQTLFEECKCEIKNNKMENVIKDVLELSSSDNKSDNDESKLRLCFNNIDLTVHNYVLDIYY